MRWAVLLALATVAHADGVVVSTRVPVVAMPEQQAILVWKDGHERLVIDTAHEGGADADLAWIVPLPAPPKIEPTSPAVFRTIEVVTMPALEDIPDRTWGAGLYLLVALAAVMLVPSRRILVRALAMFVLFGGFAFLFVLLTAKSGAPRSVSVLERGRAGSYETATVQSVDAGALLGWLDGNGFKVDPQARARIEEYVRDRWVFAVARLKSGGPGGRAHPLSFEFEAKAPVYPLRLTGTQDRPLSLRLFVLSAGRVRCDGLHVESCYEIRRNEDPHRVFQRDQEEVRTIGYEPPLLDPMTARLARIPLSLMNDQILRAASDAGRDVLDLRRVCTDPTDFVREIEPSPVGARKIAAAIHAAATGSAPRTRLFGGV
jgi:hypothetical protein